MKRRVLSLALAIVMLFSIVAVSANASVASGKVFALSLKADKTTVAPGESVNIILNYEGAEGFRSVGGGEFDIAYDSSVFTPAVAPTTEGVVFDGLVVTTGYAYDGKFNATYSNVKDVSDQDDPIIGADTYGYNSIMRVGVAQNADSWAAVDATNGADLFAVTFNVPATATAGTYRIALYTDAFTNQDKLYNYINVENYDSCYEGCQSTSYGLDNDEDLAYDFTNAYVDIKVGADEPISFLKVQTQPNGTDNWNLGIVAKVDAATDETFFGFDEVTGTSANIATVGAEVTINGETADQDVKFVYDTTDGYVYRVVIKGIARTAENANTVTVKFYYTTDGSTKVYGATYTTATLGSIYAAANGSWT